MWKSIDDRYDVSDSGQVRRKTSAVVLSPVKGKYGYMRVNLWNKKQTTRLVHALVAESFLGPRPSDGHEINHKNCDPSDNRADNLEWKSHIENSWHSRRMGRKAAGQKLSEGDVKYIKLARRIFDVRARDLSERFNVTTRHIYYILREQSWRHLTQKEAA